MWKKFWPPRLNFWHRNFILLFKVVHFVWFSSVKFKFYLVSQWIIKLLFWKWNDFEKNYCQLAAFILCNFGFHNLFSRKWWNICAKKGPTLTKASAAPAFIMRPVSAVLRSPRSSSDLAPIQTSEMKMVKFIFSEKATNFWEIFTLLLTGTT